MTNFEIFDLKKAKEHVKKFKKDNPSKPNDKYYEAHAVSVSFPKLSTHFPGLDLSELSEYVPTDSIGIRVYVGDNSQKKVNYIVFTKKPASGTIPDDIIEPVYLLKSKFFDLKNLRTPKPTGTSASEPNDKIKSQKDILGAHLSCDPDCPVISLYN